MNRYDNAKMHMEGTKLIIEIETDETVVEVAPSQSGKTMVVATTGGAATSPTGLKVNLTAYRKV